MPIFKMTIFNVKTFKMPNFKLKMGNDAMIQKRS